MTRACFCSFPQASAGSACPAIVGRPPSRLRRSRIAGCRGHLPRTHHRRDQDLYPQVRRLGGDRAKGRLRRRRDSRGARRLSARPVRNCLVQPANGRIRRQPGKPAALRDRDRPGDQGALRRRTIPSRCATASRASSRTGCKGGLPGEEFEEKGRDIPEGIEAAKMLEAAGYDAFNGDVGLLRCLVLEPPADVPGEGPVSAVQRNPQSRRSTCPSLPPGAWTTPISPPGQSRTGKTDMIGLARPLLADPELPQQGEGGQASTASGRASPARKAAWGGSPPSGKCPAR